MKIRSGIWVLSLLGMGWLWVILAQPAVASGTFSISQTFPANNASGVPVTLVGAVYHPDFGWSNQSVSLKLSGLPSSDCSLRSSSVTAQVSRLLSANPNDDQFYALTSPGFGKKDGDWWLSLSSPISGFELLPYTSYSLQLTGGSNGVLINCAGQDYMMNQSLSLTFTTGADTVAPQIMGPQARATATGATISWETFQAANGQVAYGPTAPTSQTGQSAVGKLHQIQLDHLSPGTTYAYQIRSRDAAGNLGTSEGHFTTVGLGEIKVVDIADMAATIRWTSNQPTDSLVELGTTAAYGDRQGNGGQLTNHSLRLVGLKPNQTYHFRVVATNSNGTSTFGDNVFTTLAFPAVAGKAQSAEGPTASTDNIKLFPQVPFAPPLVLGASSAASAVSDGFTVGRNLLTGKASPADHGWLIIFWIMPVILLTLIAVVWWRIRKQSTPSRPSQAGS
jgi:hypothetical protein